MSADYWLEINTGGSEPAQLCESINVTYNLGPMLRAAGFPDWDALVGAPASEAGGLVRKVGETIKANPERFDEFKPKNGWGDQRWAVEFCEMLAAECANHPKATVGGWL